MCSSRLWFKEKYWFKIPFITPICTKKMPIRAKPVLTNEKLFFSASTASYVLNLSGIYAVVHENRQRPQVEGGIYMIEAEQNVQGHQLWLIYVPKLDRKHKQFIPIFLFSRTGCWWNLVFPTQQDRIFLGYWFHWFISIFIMDMSEEFNSDNIL